MSLEDTGTEPQRLDLDAIFAGRTRAGTQDSADDDESEKAFIQGLTEKGTAGTGTSFRSDLLAWTQRLPRNIGMGLYKAGLNTVEAADDIFQESAQFIVDPPAVGQEKSIPGVKGQEDKSKIGEPFSDIEAVKPLRTQFPGFFEAAHDFADKSDEFNFASDEPTQMLAQFAIPYTLYLKAMGGLQNISLLAKAGKLALAEGVTAFTVLAADEVRVAEVFEMGRQMENKFGQVLASMSPDESLLNSYVESMTNREGESAVNARFKNAIDSLVATSVIAPPAIVLLKAVKETFRALRVLPPSKLSIPKNTRFAVEGEAEGLGIEASKLRPDVKPFQKSDARGIAALAIGATAITVEEVFTENPDARPIVEHGLRNLEEGKDFTDSEGQHSVLSGSVEDERLNNGRPTLIPFVYDGRKVDVEEAIARAVESGTEWPSADTNEELTAVSRIASTILGNLAKDK